MKLQSRWTRPFLVQFPLVPMSKGAVTDDVLSRHLSSAATGSGRIGRLARVNEQVPRVPLSDQGLEDGAFTFLADVLAHPHDVRTLRVDLISSASELKRELLFDRSEAIACGQAHATRRTQAHS